MYMEKRNYRVKNLNGKRFGRLVVIKRGRDRFLENSNKRVIHWTCVCDCGRKKDICGANLRSGQTKSCDCGKGDLKNGSLNPQWKGSKVGYAALHDWIGRRYQHNGLCELCGKKCIPDLANKSQKYKRDVTDWEYLCRSCHMEKDGRKEKLVAMHHARRFPNKACVACGKSFHPKRTTTRFCSRSCDRTHRNLNRIGTKYKI
jgi:hypothetical protein